MKTASRCCDGVECDMAMVKRRQGGGRVLVRGRDRGTRGETARGSIT